MTNKNFIKRYVILKIIVGDYKIGSSLPSENVLAKQFNCTRQTVRKVYEYLEALNVVKPKKGKGHFIESNMISNYWPLAKIISNYQFNFKKHFLNNKKFIQYEFLIENELHNCICLIRTKSTLELELNPKVKYHFEDILKLYILATNFPWTYLDEELNFSFADNKPWIISNSKLIDEENEMNNLDIEIKLNAYYYQIISRKDIN